MRWVWRARMHLSMERSRLGPEWVDATLASLDGDDSGAFVCAPGELDHRSDDCVVGLENLCRCKLSGAGVVGYP